MAYRIPVTRDEFIWRLQGKVRRAAKRSYGWLRRNGLREADVRRKIARYYWRHEAKTMAALERYGRYMRQVWRLTDAETRVATAMLSGKSNKEIAVELGLSRETVNKHLDSVYRKSKLKGKLAVFHRLLLEATM